MEVKFRDAGIDSVKADLLVLGIAEKQLDNSALRALDRRMRGNLLDRVRKSHFTGADGSSFVYGTAGLLPAAQILVLGLGSGGAVSPDGWRKAGARIRKEAASIGAEHVAVYVPPGGDVETAAAAVVEGILLSSYQFNKYRSKTNVVARINSATFFGPGLRRTAALERAVATVQDIVPGVFLARDLVNEPPSTGTAVYLSEQAERHCRGRGLTVEVWGRKKIEAMKMAGLLAVNRGSHEEPRFIHIRYRPAAKARKHVALVGKGITFDSGGLSLKQAKSMETMKIDMSGGAAVIAAMSRLPDLAPAVEVDGYVPATDNLPGANAQKPGDVIRYLNGKTIEVINTDAEGRLILADALALAAQRKPDAMINLATLTGACMVALGGEVAGLFSNDQTLADHLLRCGRETGEKLWQLPLVREYRDHIKSSVADIKNVGGAHGGAIIAALVLQEFVDGIPWAHLDIAGPAFAESETALSPRGGTGFGVRTLLRFLATF